MLSTSVPLTHLSSQLPFSRWATVKQRLSQHHEGLWQSRALNPMLQKSHLHLSNDTPLDCGNGSPKLQLQTGRSTVVWGQLTSCRKAEVTKIRTRFPHHLNKQCLAALELSFGFYCWFSRQKTMNIKSKYKKKKSVLRRKQNYKLKKYLRNVTQFHLCPQHAKHGIGWMLNCGVTKIQIIAYSMHHRQQQNSLH